MRERWLDGGRLAAKLPLHTRGPWATVGGTQRRWKILTENFDGPSKAIHKLGSIQSDFTIKRGEEESTRIATTEPLPAETWSCRGADWERASGFGSNLRRASGGGIPRGAVSALAVGESVSPPAALKN